MELTGQSRRWLQVPSIALHFSLPLYLRLMLGLSLGVLVAVSGVTMLTRLLPPPSNPFSAYADLLPGHPEQAALARGFTCFANMFDESKSCTRRDEPASPLFSRVHLSTLGDRIYTLSFDVYVNALSMGDLVLLWGRPEFWENGEIVTATWPDHHATAIARSPQSGRISYFLTILHVAFTHSGNTRWALLLMMDKLPMLCHDCTGL